MEAKRDGHSVQKRQDLARLTECRLMKFGQIYAPLVTKDAKNSPWLKQEKTRDTLSKYDVSYSHHTLATLHSRE
jgi:hypothetical protein